MYRYIRLYMGAALLAVLMLVASGEITDAMLPVYGTGPLTTGANTGSRSDSVYYTWLEGPEIVSQPGLAQTSVIQSPLCAIDASFPLLTDTPTRTPTPCPSCTS